MSLTRMILPVLALGFAFGNAMAEEKKPTLTYYYIDGWFLCNKVKVIVDDLKKEDTKGNVIYQTIRIGTPEVDAEVKKAGLELHGLVATAGDGKVIEAVEGHSYGKPKIKKVVKNLLKYEG